MTISSGFLESEGYVGIFHAVDAMSKATGVTISGVIKLGGGLVAVAVTGELATVEEAIAVGEAALAAEGGARYKSIIFANPCEPVAYLAEAPQQLV